MNISSLDSHSVAKDLLGSKICRVIQGEAVCLTITEVEVCDGFEDKASHASKGETSRTKIMFGPAGHWYVYLCYGMHNMLNLVTREQGYPAALLIRGGVTSEGVVISGPGRVTKYLNVDRTFYGMHSRKGSELYIEWNKKKNKGIITATPRIGINYAGEEWKNKKWRYVLTLPK